MLYSPVDEGASSKRGQGARRGARKGPVMVRKPFAAYLNGNARRVNPEVVARIEELIPPDDIFFCNEPADAERHGQVILDRGYPTVFTGGGDGTVVGLLNALYRRGGREAIPVLGVLALGTGNALSRLVSSGNALKDLRSYTTNPFNDLWTLSMVEWDGLLFPFGGLGVDAEILSDYIGMKESLGQGVLKPVFQNVGGYFLSFFGATAPRRVKAVLTGREPTVRIVNLGERAYRVRPDGELGRSYLPGEVLYDGPANICIAGTVPMIGYGMRLLPFADRYPQFMDLRVSRVPYSRGLVHLSSVWKGEFRDPDLFDFYANRVSLELSEPVAFQVAGDLAGRRDRLELGVVPRVARLLRFI